jgi:predicted amidohydrolase
MGRTLVVALLTAAARAHASWRAAVFTAVPARALSMAGNRRVLAIGQMCSVNDHERNLERCRALCAEAAGKGASLLSLPECFEYMGIPGSGDALATAQPLEGLPAAASSRDVSAPLFSRYQQLAKEHSLWLSLGGCQSEYV